MKTILLVEDDPDIREVTAEILRESGYDVCEAEDGQGALEQLEGMSEVPCLVLLDLSMPIMTGQELLQQLKKSERFARLPVVVVSGAGWTHADVPDANEFISKPPSVAQLLQVVREFCDRPRA
ncbi:MAG: Transcriptional regulatory protein [Myxococcaceae bacterium]|nr:Transcriptional regulatory protein [Myxococcaceae bacterium]